MKGYIYFCTGINFKTVEMLIHATTDLITQAGCDEIEIRISSEGGNLNSGLTAYNFLKGCGVKITTVNIGTVESSAIFLYLSGEDRHTLPLSRFKLHSFTWTFSTNIVEYPVLKEAVLDIEKSMDSYTNVFKDATASAKEPIDMDSCLKGSALLFGAERAITGAVSTAIIGTIDAPKRGIPCVYIQ